MNIRVLVSAKFYLSKTPFTKIFFYYVIIDHCSLCFTFQFDYICAADNRRLSLLWFSFNFILTDSCVIRRFLWLPRQLFTKSFWPLKLKIQVHATLYFILFFNNLQRVGWFYWSIFILFLGLLCQKFILRLMLWLVILSF